MPTESIADASKPNAGRIYDYTLGGNHNFEVDRQAAEQLFKILPFVPKHARLQRWALQDIAVELSERRGYDLIIDFASGLPTNDHIHNKATKGTTVIYSDFDPVVVAYAREILGDTPNVYVFEADARRPEELLNRPEVQKILAGRRKAGFVYWGVSGFLDDESIAHAASYLYDWADAGSCLAFNTQGKSIGTAEDTERVTRMYERMGTKVYGRTLEEVQKLLQPWRLDKGGFVSLLEWHGLDQTELAKEYAEYFGPLAGTYGAYLIK
jgi:S-adenosyl methyltransferase